MSKVGKSIDTNSMIDYWLPDPRGGKEQVTVNRCEISFGGDENVLKMHCDLVRAYKKSVLI